MAARVANARVANTVDGTDRQRNYGDGSDVVVVIVARTLLYGAKDAFSFFCFPRKQLFSDNDRERRFRGGQNGRVGGRPRGSD